MNTKWMLTLAVGILVGYTAHASNQTIKVNKNKEINLKVIATTDVHGCFFPYDFIKGGPMKGTLTRVSTYINRLRKEYGDRVIMLENGDILQGQPVCYYTNFIKTKEPNIAAKVVNYLKYDAQAFGNHDIETGHNVYDKWVKDLNCPVLGANIINTATGLPYTKPYTILHKGGAKVAVLGMLTAAIPNWLNESIWQGLRFESIVSSSKKWIDIIKKKEHPDVIIGLFHSGWEGGITTPDVHEDEAKDVARQVDGFDMIIFGHDHCRRDTIVTNNYGHKVLCLDPSNNAINVADANIHLTIRNGKVASKDITGKLVNICNEEPDKEYDRTFQADIDSVKKYVDRKIGVFSSPVHTRDCFFGSSSFIDFIHNIQLDITGADISLNAPLTFDSQINAGNVTMADMFTLYRFENRLYVLNMTGEEVRKLLEMSYDLWVNTMHSKDDHIMLLDNDAMNDNQRCGFKNLTFNFDSAAGIDYEVDVTKGNGHKVNIQQMSNGQPFDAHKWYKVVMNSYRGNGGGELLTKGAGIPKDSIQKRIVYQSELDQRYYITKEIEKLHTVNPQPNNNWKFVPEDWAQPALKRDRHLIFGD